MKKKAKVGIALATIIIAAGGVLAILFALDIIPLSRNKDIVDVYKAPDGSVYTLDLSTFSGYHNGYYKSDYWDAEITCKLSNAQSRIFGEMLRQGGAIGGNPRYVKYLIRADSSSKLIMILDDSFYDKRYALIIAPKKNPDYKPSWINCNRPGTVEEAIYDAMYRAAVSKRPIRYF